ncbi:hypothetical protein RB195_003187 [Necator americanus]|uniref:Trypsin Inhibitor like cysteine rich domain protein n=1 Tax=Necator americanus TaxID=51031 RepID=A0ABR1DMI5_NECAM
MFRAVVVFFAIAIVTVHCIDKECGPNEQAYEKCTREILCERRCNYKGRMVCPHPCRPNVCRCKPGYRRGPNGCQKPGPGCK